MVYYRVKQWCSRLHSKADQWPFRDQINCTVIQEIEKKLNCSNNHHHHHHIYFRQQQTMSIITNSCTVGGLPEKRIAHWVAAQIKMKMNVPQTIIQYEGTKKQQGQEAKTTKLCASAIGIMCNTTMSYNYNSHTIQLKLK